MGFLTGAAVDIDPEAFDLLREARALIEQHYVDRDAIQDRYLEYGAISGMVDALGDTGHSRFMSPEMVQAERQSLSGEFEGIGATLTFTNGQAVVIAPLEGSPAEKAGIKAGDVIVAVDGEDVTELNLSDIISRIRGPKGTDVVVSVIHSGDNTPTDIRIVRDKIALTSVTSSILPGTDVLMVRIASFSDGVGSDLKEVITQARSAGAAKIILDLRDSPGGLLEEAVVVASQFVAEGNVMLEQDADGEQRALRARPGGAATDDIPVVVLINEATASAAEIVSGALQDNDRATLVGTKTFGTGTVLNSFELDDGSALLLATRQWLTPEGRELWHKGIEPDVVVELAPGAEALTPTRAAELLDGQLTATEDTQLLKALDLLEAVRHTADKP
jgi:carboxyl-terminal processing protease